MPTTVYRSRSRTTRNWLLVAAGAVVLVMTGFLIGRSQSGDAPAAAAVTSAPAPAPSEPPPSSAPPVPVGGIDAYAPLQVEDAVAQSGTEMQDTSDEGGGRNAGWINDGDWLRFDDVNFGATPPTAPTT